MRGRAPECEVTRAKTLRPFHQTDGDITAAVAPSLPLSGVDLYIGMGGSPEGVLAAAALKCLGGDIQLRMWFDPARHPEHLAVNARFAQAGVLFAFQDDGGAALH